VDCLTRNFQLTSVSALQSSLDILRKHRPDYTPRTGFIWPISDPSLVIDGEASKTRESEAQNQSQNSGSDHPRLLEGSGTSSDCLPPEKRGSETNPRRQKNTMLLMNAMKTTAAHSKMSFTQTGPLQSQQSINELNDHQADSGTPVTGTMRSSATPGPSGPQMAGSQQEPSQEGAKGHSTGVKKKKKRLFDSVFLGLNQWLTVGFHFRSLVGTSTRPIVDGSSSYARPFSRRKPRQNSPSTVPTD